MSKAGKNPYADVEFIRAYRIELEELEREQAVEVRSYITLADTGSRLQVILEAYEPFEAGPGVPPMCRYVTEWPNANVRSFTAELYHAAVMICRLVEDSRRDLFMAASTLQRSSRQGS